MTTSATPTFTASGVEFKAADAVTTVKRANVLFNANKAPMSYSEIEAALYHGSLNPANIFRVILGYTINGVTKGIKLENNRLSLAGQRKDKKLVGAAPEAHSFVKNQVKLKAGGKVKGTITIGAKNNDLYFGYNQDTSTFAPCVASVSATYEPDSKLYAEIMALKAANPDHELEVYYVPSVDYVAWLGAMKVLAAKSA